MYQEYVERRTYIYQEYVVFQDKWSVMAAVSQDGFQCVGESLCLL